MAHRDWTAGCEIHLAPQPHVFVRRRRIPVHKCNRQIGIARRIHLDREHVRCAQFHSFRDVELVGAPGSCHLLRVGNLLPVKPDVGAVINASEIQPNRFAPVAHRQNKFFAIPPRNGERTVRLHGQIRKIGADRVIHARELPQIHAEVRVGIDLLFHHRPDHRGRHSNRVPSPGQEARGRDHLAFVVHLGGRLQPPVIA